VVTSASAAALRDIVRTLRLRCPLVRVVLAPVLVQGDGAAEQVAAALDALNTHAEADVIVVARGGGSLEELWAFNEEVVARAIARSAIPVVTGVGHETDFTIADFVADLRASTPTAAASAVVPDTTSWHDDLDAVQARLHYLIETRLASEREILRSSHHQLDRASPERRILDMRQHVDEAQQALARSIGYQLAMRGERLHGAALRLHALSPLQTLGRGFAVVRRQSDGVLITSVTHVAPGQGIAVRVADGTFAAIVGARIDETPPDSIGPAKRSRTHVGQ
jgi:exodeoxyribonuclease VII large subunit